MSFPLKSDLKKENSCSERFLPAPPNTSVPHPTKYSASRPPSAHSAGGSQKPWTSAAQSNPP